MDEAMKKRIAKLPTVLQNYISGLRSRVEQQEARIRELEAAVEAGPEGSTVFAEYGDVQRPLGDGVTVSFFVNKKAYTVEVADGGLVVDSTSQSLLIEPVETYKVVVRMKED